MNKQSVRYRFFSLQLFSLLILLGASGTASAHPGHETSGLISGLLHPFSGMDHLLAMLAIGLWAAQGSTKKIWLLPFTFMLLLATGAGFAQMLPALPLVETGIATSVLLLGLFVALAVKLPHMFSIALTAIFGFFHGYAHGLEMPGSADPALYALGFLLATASLHCIGVGMGVVARGQFSVFTRATGAAIALSGAWMLA